MASRSNVSPTTAAPVTVINVAPETAVAPASVRAKPVTVYDVSAGAYSAQRKT